MKEASTEVSTESQVLSPERPEEATNIRRVQASYLRRIRYHLHGALVWVANVEIPPWDLLSPATSPFHGPGDACNDSPDRETGEEMELYAPIIIWYVMKNCRDSLPPHFFINLAQNMSRLEDQYQGSVDLNEEMDLNSELNILTWYFYGSLNSIYHFLIDEGFSSHLQRGAPALAEFVRRMKGFKKKAEKSMDSAKQPTMGTYSTDDESIDRLAFLGIELGFLSQQASTQSSSCYAQSRKKVLDRLPTKIMNPGVTDISGKVPISAPWELSSVNHHSRLSLWNQSDLDDNDLETTRNDCLRFLTPNFHYIGTWDMSRIDVAALWWVSISPQLASSWET
jgi:hypothetical protein